MYAHLSFFKRKNYDTKRSTFPIFKRTFLIHKNNPALFASIVLKKIYFHGICALSKKKQLILCVLVRSLKKPNFTRYKCLKKNNLMHPKAAKLATLQFVGRSCTQVPCSMVRRIFRIIFYLEFAACRCSVYYSFQRQQPTRGVPETTAYSWWHYQMSSTSANCCQLIPQDRAMVFPALGQLAAAELTHHSLKPLRLPYSSRLRLSLLLAGDVHPNHGPATQSLCAVCTATSQVEESALSATNVPAGCIRSVLVFKTQHSTERRKTGLAALAIPLQPHLNLKHLHPLHQQLSTMPISLSYNGTQTE